MSWTRFSLSSFVVRSFALVAGVAASITTFAAGNAPQPSICTRGCWGAQAPNANISQMATLNRAIVHHTAGNEFNTSGYEASKANVRAVQSYHRNTMGWGDIGYHFLIDKFGHIFEGRSGAMSSLPRGAHDAANTNSFGFTLLGYFHPNVNNVPTAAMMDSLYDVIAWRMPNGWTAYGSPGGTYGTQGVNVGRIDAHRRVKATACPGDHVFNPYMGSNINAGAIRAEVQARINGAPPTINPPFHFNSDSMGWTPGNNVSGIAYTNSGWPGCIYTDQTGGDAWIYSPPTNFQGSANQLIKVRVFPQSGWGVTHDMQVFWKTNASNHWDSAKSTNLAGIHVHNNWVDVYMHLNQHWTGQTINQLRLDFDQNHQGTRWIVDSLEIVNIQQPPYNFDSNAMGFTLGNGLTGHAWTNCCGWPGIMYADQAGADGFFLGPLAYFSGGANDWIKVRVFPQGGSTANHDMQIHWATTEETGMSASKASSIVQYSAKDTWADVYLQVGNNPKWAGKTILQLRLDVDQANTGTRWIVDSIQVSGPPPVPPSAPSGLSATGVSNSQINLSWTDNSTNESNFVVQRSTSSGGPYTTIATLGANVTSYNNTGLSANTTYYYVVKATNGGGSSANSNQASAATLNNPPAAPGSLSASGINTSQVNLSWADNSSDETNFVVARSNTPGGPYTDIVTLGANTTSYNNTGLAANTTYYYVVRATNGAGASANSNQASGLTWPNEIVVDNSSGAFSASVDWAASTYAADKYGSDYRHRPTSAVSDAAVWNLTIPQNRNYEVYVWWSQGTNRSPAAPYLHLDNSSVPMNQQSGGGAWNSLGIRSASAGAASVKLSCWAASGYVVIADAVRLVPR